MTTITKSEVIPFSPSQIFEVVNDIESYPEFIAWCQNAILQSKNPSKLVGTIQGERLGINFAFGFYYIFQVNRTIEIHLVHSGPFKKIVGYWRFEPLGENETRFSFELEFEFMNTFLGWTLTPIIKNEAGKVLKDFSARAKKLYG